MASASRPLLGVRTVLGRVSNGRFSPRISQAPPTTPGDGSGVPPLIAAALLALLDLLDEECRLDPETEGRGADLDLSL